MCWKKKSVKMFLPTINMSSNVEAKKRKKWRKIEDLAVVDYIFHTSFDSKKITEKKEKNIDFLHLHLLLNIFMFLVFINCERKIWLHFSYFEENSREIIKFSMKNYLTKFVSVLLLSWIMMIQPSLMIQWGFWT